MFNGRSNKGGILDAFFLTFAVVLAICGIVIVYYVIGSIQQSLDGDAAIPDSAMVSMNYGLGAVGLFDYLMVFVYFGSMIGAILSAFAVRTHPIFAAIFLLVQIFLVAISPMLSEFYNSIAVSLPAASSMFPFTSWLISYLPIVTLIISLLIALAMFALPQSQGVGYYG